MKWWKNLTDSVGLTNYGDVESAKNAIKQNQELANQTKTENEALLQNLLTNAQNTYGTGASKYNDYLSSYENMGSLEDYLKNAGQNTTYSYDKDVNDFYSPAANSRVQTAMNAIQNSRANAGNMFSSDTSNEMNAKAQLMASEEWDKAYERMNEDKTSDLNTWKANNENLNNLYSSQLTKATNLLNLANSDRNSLYNAESNYYNNLVNNNNAAMSTQAGLTNAYTNASLNQQGIGSGLFKLGTGILTALM